MIGTRRSSAPFPPPLVQPCFSVHTGTHFGVKCALGVFMPTSKPRITITTTQPIAETIGRLATLQGCSKSHVVNDLLEAVHPPLMRTVALLEAAQEAPRQVRAGLHDTIHALEMEITGDLGKSLAQMDWLTGKLTASDGEAGR